MPPRFPTPTTLTEPQIKIRTLAEKIAPPGVQYEVNGSLQGPFAPYLYTPTLIDNYWEGALIAIKQPPLVEHPRDIKIVIFATLSTMTPHPFILKAHTAPSLELGFSQGQLDEMLKGEIPQDLSKEEKVLCDFAQTVARERGPIGKELWERTVGVLGRERVAANVHMVNGYMQANILCWVADGGKSPELK